MLLEPHILYLEHDQCQYRDMKERGGVSTGGSTVCPGFALGQHQLHVWNNPVVAWIVSQRLCTGWCYLSEFCALGSML